MTHIVCYQVFDSDKFLYVRPANNLFRNEQHIFTGTEKECRQYVIDNQLKASTPSLKKALPNKDKNGY